MWKSIQEQTETALDIGELFDKTTMNYRGTRYLVTRILYGKLTFVIPRKNRYNKDLVELLGTTKVQARYISKFLKTIPKAKESKKILIFNG